MKNRSVITITLLLANLCVVVIFVSGWVNPGAQNKKEIVRRLTLVKEPVDVSYKFKGQPLNAQHAVRASEGESADEFDGDADWLKDLTIRLRNKSGKTITYIQVNLRFPDVTNSNGSTALQQVFLGVDPDRKFTRPELHLAPNEMVEIPLTDQYPKLSSLVESVGKVSIGSVSKIWVEFHAAYFDDGTLFQAGTFYKRNPDQNDPNKWIKIDNP